MSYIPKIEKKIKDVGKKLDNIGRHQDDILQLEIDIKQIEAENEAKVQGVRNLNDRKIQSYLETIKALNTGGMNTEKISGETEEEYLDRIIANAEIDTPDQSIFDATEYAKRKFKEHMKELFRSESLIESVANQIQYIGNELKIKTSINKKFPIFKREFIETFGKNNKEITSGDIIEFIKAFITGETSIIKELKKIVTEVKDIKQEKEVKKPEIEKAPIESVFSIIGEKDIIYFMPILSDPEDGEEHYELLWSNSLNRHTFHELKSDISFKQIKKISGLKKSEILQQIKGNSPSFMAERLVQMGIQPITYNDKSKPFNSYDPEQDEIIYGWGIEPEKIPDIVPFGKCKLHLHKLYYKNNLVVKHKDNSNIIGLPNIIVSDEFVKLIMKLLKGEDIKQKDLNTLKTMELHLWNRLIVLAELHKKHPIESNKTIDHLKHQLELLTGEIEAGNDNKDLVKQLHQVVHSLKNFGAITSTSAKDFIKQYK